MPPFGPWNPRAPSSYAPVRARLALTLSLFEEVITMQMTAAAATASRFSTGVRQGVAMDYLKYHSGPTCPNLLRPAGEPPQKRPNGRYRGDPPARRATCGRLLPLWTPHAVRLCVSPLKRRVFAEAGIVNRS
jgi:hypothetical protein